MKTWKRRLALVTTCGMIIVGAIIFFRQQTPTMIPTISEKNGNGEFLNTVKSVGYFREHIENHPDNPRNYVQLAQLFIQEARVSGKDLEYVPKAEYLLDQAINIDKTNFEALSVQASLFANLHQFEKAEQTARAALAQNPYSSFAQGVLVDALVELGRYEEAVQACDKLLALRPDLRSYSRASYLRELHGDLPGAIIAMTSAADAGVWGSENRAWTLFNLGNLFLHMGKKDTAAYVYRGVLQERASYAFALSGLAEVEISRGNYDRAISLADSAFAAMNEHHFLEQAARVYQLLGNNNKEAELVERVLSDLEAHERHGWNIDLDYAALCAQHRTHLEEAMKRIQRDVQRRPDHTEVLEIYAWLTHLTGQSKSAVPLIERALRLNSLDIELHKRAEEIFRAAGENKRADRELQIMHGKSHSPSLASM